MISKAKPYMLNALKELWILGFGSSREHVDSVFSDYLNLDNIIVYLGKGKRPIAMICYENACLSGKYATWKASYLFSFTVHPNYRDEDIGSRLLKAAESYFKAKYYDALIVVPPANEVYKYYENFGFETSFYSQEVEINPVLLRSDKNIVLLPKKFEDLADCQNNNRLEKDLQVRWNGDYLRYIGRDLKRCNGETLLISVDNEKGYFTYYIKDNTAFIDDFSINPALFDNVLYSLNKRINAKNFVISLPVGYFGLKADNILPLGMIKWYDDRKVNINVENPPFLAHTMR